MLETGKLSSRGQLYIEIHKRKDGSLVNEAAKTIAVCFSLVTSFSRIVLNLKTFIFHFITCLQEQIEVGLTQSISEVSPLDAIGRVLGLKHSGECDAWD